MRKRLDAMFNTFDATLKTLEKLHQITCPNCPKVSPRFEEKYCKTCSRKGTRTAWAIGYAHLNHLSKEPYATGISIDE